MMSTRVECGESENEPGGVRPDQRPRQGEQDLTVRPGELSQLLKRAPDILKATVPDN